jgi:RNA-directed DNA polymerase
MTAFAFAIAMADLAVNGPEDVGYDWDAIDWRSQEDNVRRLRQRIFKATREGDLKRVRNLQKLMLRSHSNTLCSVRQVTQRNAGRKTAGIDGQVVLTSHERAELARRLQCHARPWSASPVKRVYIPKANGKQRPLGIPVIADRVQQARVKNALEPEWEARFEPRSYGFRPGRGCHDAIEMIFKALCGDRSQRRWVLDADLAAAFDRINHDRLLAQIGQFPARGAIQRWLTAGVMERGQFTPTAEGTPQGGVISPLLLNVALHGMEQAAGVRYRGSARKIAHAAPNSPVLVRYADDYVALCHSREQAEQVKQRLTAWLEPRGLRFNEDKTQIVHAEDGFSFLGFDIRRYVDRQGSGKLLIKPSAESVKRLRKRLSTDIRALRGANAAAVIFHLNPIVKGWSAYYRSVVSSKIFSALDHHMWHLTYRWASRTHPNKPKGWITARYFGTFNKSRNDKWVFGDRDSGTYLAKFAWTRIVRHVPVPGRASPDDPDLTEYWANRRNKHRPPLHEHTLRLLKNQRGRCPLCGELLLHADHEPRSPREWEQWFTTVRRTITKQYLVQQPKTHSERSRHRLLHAHCHRRQHRAMAEVNPLQPPPRP